MDLIQSARNAYESLFGGPSNLSTAERAGSTILGLAALGTAPRMKPLPGALLALGGLTLVGRGVSGHCPVKAAMTEGSESTALGHETRHAARIGSERSMADVGPEEIPM